MSVSQVLCWAFLFCIVIQRTTSANVGTFLHISDVHHDPYYGQGTYPLSSSCTLEIDPTRYPLGNYECDSPWELVEGAFQQISETITANTDFVIWTGDTPGALEQSLLDNLTTLAIIQNVTTALDDRLGNIPVFPSIGNHDNNIKHLLKPEPNAFRDELANIWSVWLQDYPDAVDNFKQGGYYATPINANLLLVSLNTAMYYFKDTLTDGIPDPAGQFAWLEDTLQNAVDSDKKVFIAAHILPGSLEREVKVSFQPSFNERYLGIIRKFSHVIQGQFYGHHHYDSFRVLYNEAGSPVNALYVQPAITPRKSPTARNPSFRIMTYDRDTGDIIDLHQYYLDLSSDNPSWSLEYRATEAYSIPDLSPQSLHELAQSFALDASVSAISDHGAASSSAADLFSLYYQHNTVMVDGGECDDECRRLHFCAITELDISAFNDCRDSGAVANSGGGVIGLVVLALVAHFFSASTH